MDRELPLVRLYLLHVALYAFPFALLLDSRLVDFILIVVARRRLLARVVLFSFSFEQFVAMSLEYLALGSLKAFLLLLLSILLSK